MDQPTIYSEQEFQDAFKDPHLINFEGSNIIVNIYTHGEIKRAVKTIKQGIQDHHSQSHFLLWNQGQILKSLFDQQHDHIIRLIGHTQDFKKLILEYYPNNTLQNLVFYGNFLERFAKRLMIQLAQTVYYLHIDKNIIHGDIKLQSILISTQYTIKLCDFSFAQEIHRQNKGQDQQQNQPLGYSVGYSAPEIFTPPVEDLAKVDIFALGVVFFKLLMGFPPFNTNEPKDYVIDQYWNTLNKQEYQQFWDLIRLKSELLISDNFKTLIQGMLHPESQQRWSIEEVINCDYLKENMDVANENEVINELQKRVELIDQENQ